MTQAAKQEENQPIWQGLMDKAYKKWQEGGALEDASKEEFFKALPFEEKVAVSLGNFNYQVTNGGFEQWSFNGYRATHAQFIRTLLTSLDQEKYPLSKQVLDIINSSGRSQWTKNEADTAYYAIYEKWLDEVEGLIKDIQANPSFSKRKAVPQGPDYYEGQLLRATKSGKWSRRTDYITLKVLKVNVTNIQVMTVLEDGTPYEHRKDQKEADYRINRERGTLKTQAGTWITIISEEQFKQHKDFLKTEALRREEYQLAQDEQKLEALQREIEVRRQRIGEMKNA